MITRPPDTDTQKMTDAAIQALTAIVPAAARDVAAQAIASAFPGGSLQFVEPMHGGMSGSLVAKIVVDQQPFVLRLIQQQNAFNNPLRQFTCMQIAAEIGVAPSVVYADAQRGVSICAYVTPPAIPVARDAAQLGSLISTLHRGPAFPANRDAFQYIDDAVAELTAGGTALPRLVEALLPRYDAVKRALARHVISVPCHNDLNPGNVLTDGERMWLVDWDSAAMGDPMYDLAGLIHWFGLDDARTATFLTAYFERAPTAHEAAKLLLMEQVSWCAYTLIFLQISRGPDGFGDVDAIPRESLPSFVEALGELRRGELQLQHVEARRRLALVMANQSLNAMDQPVFHAAMQQLSPQLSDSSPALPT